MKVSAMPLQRDPPERAADEFAAAFAGTVLAELYDYWRAKRGGRFAPSRADIDPVEIPRLLPHLMLVDVVDGGARFRYRLAGTEIESRFGCSMVGRYIDEMMRGRYSDYLHDLYRELLASRRPLYSESAYASDDSAPLQARRLMLPLSADGSVIDMVLAGQWFTYRHPAAAGTVIKTQDRFEEPRPRMIAGFGK
jgi:hypothetical protein